MGSSNAEIMAAGDLEAQPILHHPNWFIHHKHMLRANQEEEVNKLGYFILKVPEHQRQPPEEFTPYGWRFGLHNREDLDSSGSEALKLSIAVQYGLVGEKWDDFCNTIVDDPKSMLICYGLEEVVTTWSDEQVKHVLALDALFLAHYMDLYIPAKERQLWVSGVISFYPNKDNVFHSRYQDWRNLIFCDLGKVENQIPYVLIQRVIKYLCPHKKELSCDVKYLERGLDYTIIDICRGFMDISNESFKSETPCPLEERTHILKVAYGVICGSVPMKSDYSVKKYEHVPSATTLKHAGIKIVAVEGPLCEMCYVNKCLFLPKMNMYKTTVSIIRNMAWFEYTSVKDGCLCHDYVILMLDLIQAPIDLDLLIDCGIIHNACGIKAFGMWKSLEEGLIEVHSSKEHHAMKLNIQRRCKMRRYRLWSEFRILFCSRPWLVISTVAVVLVTVGTLIQAYTAVIGSHKMKPQFP